MLKKERPVSWLWKGMLAAGLGVVAVWMARKYRHPLMARTDKVAGWATDQAQKTVKAVRQKWQEAKSTAEKEMAADPGVQSAFNLIDKAAEAMGGTQDMVTEYAREFRPGLRITPMTYRRIKRKPLQKKE